LPFFWGIGLAAHALSVFLPTFVLGRDWEEKKIKELMDKNK
ncbi:MAG: 2TM domain-containing protein, partial [Chryseobacterium sp.]